MSAGVIRTGIGGTLSGEVIVVIEPPWPGWDPVPPAASAAGALGRRVGVVAAVAAVGVDAAADRVSREADRDAASGPASARRIVPRVRRGLAVGVEGARTEERGRADPDRTAAVAALLGVAVVALAAARASAEGHVIEQRVGDRGSSDTADQP
jgi:hypothetical protein